MLTDEEFYALFRNFKRTAFHLEMRDKYGLDSEEGPFQLFMRGDPDDYAWHAPWLEIVRDATAAGKEVDRARIVTVPHSDYTRWSLANAPLNIEAGEDIRWLPRHEVGDIELPPQDFWLFDDERSCGRPSTPMAVSSARSRNETRGSFHNVAPHTKGFGQSRFRIATTYEQHGSSGPESLGHRLRDLRKDAGLTGRQLAEAAGWYPSKVSKIEYGRQTPSEDDIRQWCGHCDAADQIGELIAAVRHLESMYVEWRRTLRAGTKRRQQSSIALEAETKLFRWYEPVIMPGLVQTEEYAGAMLRRWSASGRSWTSVSGTKVP